MSSGSTHAKATLLVGSVTATGMFFLGFPTSEILGATLGFVLSLFVNPDLDLNTKFPSTEPKKWLWWLYWYPYSRLIPHRHALSHTPVMSSLLRILYILPLPLIIYKLSPTLLLPFFVGLVLSDTLHIFMDVVSTSIKHYRHAALTAFSMIYRKR